MPVDIALFCLVGVKLLTETRDEKGVIP